MRAAFTLIALSVLIAAVYSIDFDEFTRSNGKSYANAAERARRKEIFNQNLRKIDAMNEEARKNNESVVYAPNQYTDLTNEEFLANHTGFKRRSSRGKRAINIDEIAVKTKSAASIKTAVTSFDWTTTSYVASVKNQGSCGSCWAFGAIAATESYYAIKNKVSVTPLSEQQVVDCYSPPNLGCNGGDHLSALAYLRAYGAVKGSDYPYTAKLGTCRASSFVKFVKAYFNTYIYTTTNEVYMMSYLQTYGPMAVALDATKLSSYKTGVLSSCNRNINHVVTLVGFGTDPVTGQNYWKLRNSWGPSWGENGHFRLLRNGNICGIAQEVYFLG